MNKTNLLGKGFIAAVSCISLFTQPALAESNWNISGWINEGLTYYDDGVGSDVVQASDNGTQLGSRVTLSGSTDLPSSNLTAGFEVILEVLSGNTPLILGNQSTFGDGAASTIAPLGHNVYVSSDWGKVTLGLQSMPTDNIAVLADPSLTLWSGISPVYRGNGFTIQGVGAGAKNTVWGGFLNCLTNPGLQGAGGIGFDCNGVYRQGIRYDLPAFGPVTVAVSYANDDVYDIAANYNSQLGRLKSVLGIGYAINQGTDGTVVGGNEASMFTVQGGLIDPVTGLFGSVAYMAEEADNATAGAGDDTDAYYIKVGIKKGFNSLGDTAIYGEYGSYNDQFGGAQVDGVTGSEIERIGFSIDQYFGSRLIIYGKYENLDLSVDGSAAAQTLYGGAQDLDLFTTGMVFFF